MISNIGHSVSRDENPAEIYPHVCWTNSRCVLQNVPCQTPPRGSWRVVGMWQCRGTDRHGPVSVGLLVQVEEEQDSENYVACTVKYECVTSADALVSGRLNS